MVNKNKKATPATSTPVTAAAVATQPAPQAKAKGGMANIGANAGQVPQLAAPQAKASHANRYAGTCTWLGNLTATGAMRALGTLSQQQGWLLQPSKVHKTLGTLGLNPSPTTTNIQFAAGKKGGNCGGRGTAPALSKAQITGFVAAYNKLYPQGKIKYTQPNGK